MGGRFRIPRLSHEGTYCQPRNYVGRSVPDKARVPSRKFGLDLPILLGDIVHGMAKDVKEKSQNRETFDAKEQEFMEQLRVYYREMGSKGGRARSQRKREAAARNLEKARENRWKR